MSGADTTAPPSPIKHIVGLILSRLGPIPWFGEGSTGSKFVCKACNISLPGLITELDANKDDQIEQFDTVDGYYYKNTAKQRFLVTYTPDDAQTPPPGTILLISIENVSADGKRKVAVSCDVNGKTVYDKEGYVVDNETLRTLAPIDNTEYSIFFEWRKHPKVRMTLETTFYFSKESGGDGMDLAATFQDLCIAAKTTAQNRAPTPG